MPRDFMKIQMSLDLVADCARQVSRKLKALIRFITLMTFKEPSTA